MNMKFFKDLAQKSLEKASANEPEPEVSDEGIKDLVAKIPEMEKQVEQLRAMKGMPGIDNALKMLEGQLNTLKAVAQMQSDPAAAAKMSSQAAASTVKMDFGGLSDADAMGMAAAQKPASQRPASQKLNPLTMPQFQPLPGGLAPTWVDDKHIEFGSYPQAADGGVKRILWRVLEEKDGHLLLLSEYILDSRYWHFEKRDIPKTGKAEDIKRAMIPWEECDLRKWLNGHFYSAAFNAAEKNAIVTRLNAGNGAYLHHDYVAKRGDERNINMLSTETYETYEERDCRGASDNVFLLSVDEALRYFGKGHIIPDTVWPANLDRAAKPTDFALKRGSLTETGRYAPIDTALLKTGYRKGKDYIVLEEYSGFMGWFLRSAGSNDLALTNAGVHQGQLSNVTALGGINAGGTGQRVLHVGVRPAILINIP
ncbi:MAG: DUF6273 domain-containing protein [Oscillospiraceae bacterium]|nr:DUF6273 domain-containing protein [Oscillospiraceae bacterium]